ncbi:MAG: hypothetical protein AB2807_03570 [Candidatus Sedimenticola endophacoides]
MILKGAVQISQAQVAGISGLGKQGKIRQTQIRNQLGLLMQKIRSLFSLVECINYAKYE